MSKRERDMSQKTTKTVEQVLKRSAETLYTANLGLDLVQGKNPQNRIAGIRNVIVFGRAVTNVIQNIRSIDPRFDEWYKIFVDEMKNDPLMRFFYEMRSEILKEGAVSISTSMGFTGNPMDVMKNFKLPPGAKGFFIGDQLGGSGWQVETEDGIIEKYYVELPDNPTVYQIDIKINFPAAPEQYRQTPVADLCEKYLAYLSKLIDAAKSYFLVK